MVFGPLGLLRPGRVVDIEGIRVPLPRAGDLMVEKLLTDRTGEKGARDLLVVAGLLSEATAPELEDFLEVTRALSDESRHAVVSNLTLLSLMERRPGMPSPERVRPQIARLLGAMEA